MSLPSLLSNPAFTDKLVIFAVLVAAILKLGFERQAREEARERRTKKTSRRRR